MVEEERRAYTRGYQSYCAERRISWCVRSCWCRKGRRVWVAPWPRCSPNDILQSSLLSAIIGDMNRREGEVRVYGNIAYAPQNPW